PVELTVQLPKALLLPYTTLFRSPRKDAAVAVASKGRNNANNPDGYEYAAYTYQVYANVAPLNPTKELRSVTFPTGTTAKLFDVRPVTLGLPDAPSGDVWASDLEWRSEEHTSELQSRE